MKCRFCNSKVELFLDMSHIPISVTSGAGVVNTGIVLYKCCNCELIQKDASMKSQIDYFQSASNQLLLKGKEQVKFIDGIGWQPFISFRSISNALKYAKELADDYI